MIGASYAKNNSFRQKNLPVFKEYCCKALTVEIEG